MAHHTIRVNEKTWKYIQENKGYISIVKFIEQKLLNPEEKKDKKGK